MTDVKTELLKTARSVLLDQIIHEEEGEQRLFGIKIAKKLVEEISKEVDKVKIKTGLRKSETADVNGTSLQGYVNTTYAKLVETFGEPSHDGDGYKVDAEWVLADDNGVAVTIYNYKDGKNYLGEVEGTPVEEIRDWHIGGRNENAVFLVEEAYPLQFTEKVGCKMSRRYYQEDWLDGDDFGCDFADPGGRSALRAASKDNPRNLPCPTCGAPDRLTPADRALGYQCDSCADRAEGHYGCCSYGDY